MPKYVYKCEQCEEHFEVYHGMNECQDNCIYCSALSLHRVPQMPFIKRQKLSKGKKVGDEVKHAIESNRAILEETKKDTIKNWEPQNDN
tara:strand:- start:713 stop:979 length:267 start_codon:yes stop_codon:yes gene_type:complete